MASEQRVFIAETFRKQGGVTMRENYQDIDIGYAA
jgi:hypothetical protein